VSCAEPVKERHKSQVIRWHQPPFSSLWCNVFM